MAFVKWVDKLGRVLEIVVGLILALMTIVVFYQVLVRFVISSLGSQFSAPWTEELARYLMIWLTFIGSAIAARRAKLIAVEALVFLLPAMAGKTIKVLSYLASIAFYLIMAFIGWEWTMFGLSETAPVMRIPMSFVYSSMLVGAVLLTINTVAFLIETFATGKDIRESGNDEQEEADLVAGQQLERG
ncbi:TRAP transporter small permease [Brevibacillus ruminantium]|uniref:TRAP transporter small permease n=1 Tax=Brevibacillus ruminantium TaxID=2950604 RepID=A0ABY4WHG6_9BACL|nr:TRAP transporter small permease [Brevibacillus ruminantium]USG66567.1 TRAP transporter small permease [Brevibacillus ruminantium]